MNPYRVIVLDDDPTGTQTVHDIRVYTDWEEVTLREALKENSLFFVLTNSRSFSRVKTIQEHETIGDRLKSLCQEMGLIPLVISRGDSTLRGHFPEETEALAKGLGGGFDGEVIMPFFPEGGRFTKDDIHYVKQPDGTLCPAGETEFAKDRTFGYHASDLKQWVEEKTGGRVRAKDCLSVPLGMERKEITALLMKAEHFQKIIVNAMSYGDVQTFTDALWDALKAGKRFLYRTAAAFPKVLGGVTDQPLLGGERICGGESAVGGLVIIGSHVPKSTLQLNALQKALPNLAYLEFDAAAAMTGEGERLAEEAADFARKAMEQGQTAVVYTSRKRIDLPKLSGEEQLQASVRVSQALTSIPPRLGLRPRYLIAKGGITSSDIATRALKVRSALVLGQVAPGVPVWLTGEESLYPGMPYIIFPGNVGAENTLADIVETLEKRL